MELMPSRLRDILPMIGFSPEIPLKDTKVYARFVDSSGSWRWYALEFDGDDTFFGLVVSGRVAVAGQFTLTELRSIRCEEGGRRDTGVELDRQFEACTVEELAEVETALREILASPSPRELNLGSDLVDLDV